MFSCTYSKKTLKGTKIFIDAPLRFASGEWRVENGELLAQANVLTYPDAVVN
jgi:hypothetical protein